MIDDQSVLIVNFLKLASDGDIIKLKCCLEESPSIINAVSEDGETALWKAIRNGHTDIVRLLLEMGSDVDTLGIFPGESYESDPFTALKLACIMNNLPIVELLISKGADINFRSQRTGSSLLFTVYHGYEYITSILLDHGAHVDDINRLGSTSLHLASMHDKESTIILLLQRGANIEHQNNAGRTPLHCAARDGCCKAIETLLNFGADVNKKGEMTGNTALHWAAENDQETAVTLLLDRGAHINIQNNDGKTALHLASLSGHISIMRVLLSRKACALCHDKHGDPIRHPKPLTLESHHPYRDNTMEHIPVRIPNATGYSVEFDSHSAISRGHITFYKDRSLEEYWGEKQYFGDAYIAKNYPGVNGNSPLTIYSDNFVLYFEAGHGHYDWGYKLNITPLFLQSCMDDLEEPQTMEMWEEYIRLANGWSALMWASYRGHEDAVRLLLEYACFIDATDWGGDTALSLALENFNKHTAVLLLEAGARVDIVNKRGETPLGVALLSNERVFVTAFLTEFYPFEHEEEGKMKQDAVIAWHCILSHTESYIDQVCDVLDRFTLQLSSLVNCTDTSGRRAIDVARPAYKKAMMQRLYFFKRYELKDDLYEYKSSTVTVIRARDYDEKGVIEVVLKFMKEKSRFLREISARDEGDFDKAVVIGVIRSHNSDEDPSFRAETNKKGMYPYCVVMPAADISLFSILTHEYIAGKEWDQLRSICIDVTKALAHLHSKRFLHGDIQGRNFMRSGGRYLLVDFDSCVSLETGYSGALHSSAFAPPELLDEVDKKVLMRTYTTDPISGLPILVNLPYELLPANKAHDIWSLGVIFFRMFAAEHLFNVNDSGNIDTENMWKLYWWSDKFKRERLLKISNIQARNLVSRMLSKNPSHRPDTARVLAHPFLSGKKATRMVGEQSEFDVFLSYRVASDFKLVETLYDMLTSLDLRVWWDKRCLEAGQEWEEGFCKGLVKSAVFVALISKQGMFNMNTSRMNFSSLSAESECDNVFLEHRMALELKHMGLLEAIYPIMIGDSLHSCMTEKDNINFSSHVFSRFSVRNIRFSDEAVLSVEEKLREHLDKQGLGAPMSDKLSVSEVWNKIRAHQGGYLEGSGLISLKNLSTIIKDTVDICKGMKHDVITREESVKTENSYSLNMELNSKINILKRSLYRERVVSSLVIVVLVSVAFIQYIKKK